MSVIAEMAVNVIAKTNELAGGLNKAAGAFGGLHGKIASMVPSLDAVNGLLGGIALGGMAAGFVSVAEGLEDVLQTSQRLGIASEQFMSLRMGAKDANIEVETFDKAMTRLYKSLGDASLGSKSAAKGFEKLGIDVESFTKLDAATQMAVIADRMQQLPDATQRTSAAMALFGKAGADMQKMLSGGAEGIRDVMAAADAMGVSTFTEERLAHVVAFNDAMDRLKNLIGVTGQNLVIEIAPAAEEAVTALAAIVEQTLPYAGYAAAAIANAMAKDEALRKTKTYRGMTDYLGAQTTDEKRYDFGAYLGATLDLAGGLGGSQNMTRNSEGKVIDIQRKQLDVQEQMVREIRRNNEDIFSVGGSW